MKKTAAKSTAKTPAPAAKAVSPAKKTPVKKTAASVKKAVAPAPEPVSIPKPAAKARPPKAPSPKPQAQGAPVTTTIVAAVDVGYGNRLTVRGEGPGLSWETGVPLKCTADDRWTITLPETSHPIVCKFLINDSVWCSGEDYTVLPGSSVVLSPTF
jgi:hypothetical protein